MTIPDSLPVAGSMDWREFRARLVADARASGSSALMVALPGSMGADVWAHELPSPEKGGLLLAHPQMFTQNQTYFHQAVILLLHHGPDGSYGVILNRPTQYTLRQVRSSVSSVLDAFPDNRLYMGGDCGDTAMVVVTRRSDIPGVTPVTAGVYHQSVHAAQQAVLSGAAAPSDFRFFAQYAGWAPGQLAAECAAGVWFCAAASPALTLDDEASRGRALWHRVLQAMGGDHGRVSDIVLQMEQREGRLGGSAGVALAPEAENSAAGGAAGGSGSSS